VNRTLSELKSEGLIAMDGHEFGILDRAAFQILAESVRENSCYRANFGRTVNCDRGIYQRPCTLAIAQQEYFVLGANRSWTQVATSRCMHLIDAPKEEGEYDFVG
jgi:hypothetical protein